MGAAPVSPALTAGEAVASAYGHQARVAQMTEALVAVRPIIAGLLHEADHQMTRALGLIDAALSASPVKEVRYGRWMISYDPPLASTGRCDWTYRHDDQSGIEDRRCGVAASIAQAMSEIDAKEEEARS